MDVKEKKGENGKSEKLSESRRGQNIKNKDIKVKTVEKDGCPNLKKAKKEVDPI